VHLQVRERGRLVPIHNRLHGRAPDPDGRSASAAARARFALHHSAA
jgi:hypothetical protein